jgi:imidazolonepropionase-like amidohydrolase
MRNRYRWLGLAAIITVAALATAGAQGRGQGPGPTRPQLPSLGKGKLALVGGMLLDGYEVPPLHHAAVLVEDNKITWVGRAADAKIPPDATVIDTSGRTMMPGMMDLHAHLMILGHGNYGVWFPWIAKNGVQRVMEISAKQLVNAGVTTAVDLSAPLKESLLVRDRINRGEVPGPRMLMSGPWITLSLGSYPPEPNFQIKVTTPDEAAAETDKLAQAGVDVIKAYPMSRAHYEKVVQTARKHRLAVHAHVYGEQQVRDAFDAGVDVLTHVGSAGDTPPYSPEMIRDIVNAGRPVVVTAAHRSWVFPATVEFPERLQDPQLKKDFPPDIYEEVQRSLKDWHRLGYFGRTDRAMLFRERGLKQFIESGAVMGMGTDSGTPMNFHTEALWREIKAHVDMGMSPQRAISAATRVNARIIGRGRDLGTIEPGKLADIIVVKGDPLFNIMALADVEVVVKDGQVVKGGPARPARQTTTAQRQQ